MLLGTLLATLLTTSTPALEQGARVAEFPRRPAIHRVQYRPPRRGAPKSRVGGATRGGEGDALVVQLLSPDHAGHAFRDQPTLYWYLSEASPGGRIEITVVDEETLDTLVETEPKAPIAAGIQAISLADLGVTLKPGVEYRVSVAVVVSEESRSPDIASSATIRRVARFARPVAGTSALDRATWFAERGLWYDAIEVLSGAIEKAPDAVALCEARARLLDEVDLTRLAAHDRQ